jgi:hypothetical protein
VAGEQLGNFPQAFGHMSLINAAINLDCQLEPCRLAKPHPGRPVGGGPGRRQPIILANCSASCVTFAAAAVTVVTFPAPRMTAAIS